MEIHQVSVGEWMNSLMSRMDNAADGDCFCLPTAMHLHAFSLIKEQYFGNKNLDVRVLGEAKLDTLEVK